MNGDTFIEKSPDFKRYNADDITVLVRQDYCYLSAYEDVYMTKIKEDQWELGYGGRRQEETATIRIPTKPMLSIIDQFPAVMESLKEEWGVFVHVTKPKHVVEVDAIDREVSEVSQLSHSHELHFDMDKVVSYVGEKMLIHGGLFDVVTGEGISDKEIWIAVDNQPRMIVRTDAKGRFAWEYAYSVEGEHEIFAISAEPPNVSDKVRVKIDHISEQ